MLVYDGLRDWVSENYGTVREFCKNSSLDENNLNLIISGKRGTKTKTLNEICKFSGLKIEQIVRWVPDTVKRIDREYESGDPCYDKLEKILIERGLSRRKLSLEIGLSESGIGRKLNTKSEKGGFIAYRTLRKIADYLNVSPLDLFEIKTDSEKKDEVSTVRKKVSASKLSKKMNEAGLTMNRLATLSGVSCASIYNVLNKNVKMRELSLFKIANALGIDVEDLYEQEE
jgi:DNA-binding Xre family transcriptional regulator/DNA-binding XRE family transcriptional regulator